MAIPSVIRGHEGSRVRSRRCICLISTLLLPVPFQFTSVAPALWMSPGSLVIDQRTSGCLHRNERSIGIETVIYMPCNISCEAQALFAEIFGLRYNAKEIYDDIVSGAFWNWLLHLLVVRSVPA